MYKKTFSKECQESLQTELDIIYPWSCKQKNIDSLNYDGLLTDLKTYWNQEARFREGFKITENTVTIPNFFTKINGVFKSNREQKNLEKFLTSAKDTLYFDSLKAFSESLITKGISDDYFENHVYKNDESLQLLAKKLNCSEGIIRSHLASMKDKDSYLFIRLSPFIKEQCRNKLKEFYEAKVDIKRGGFENNLIILKDCYVELLNNYDYAFNVPKLVIKEQKDELFSDTQIAYLYFFNLLGFDIVILNPYGKNDLNSYLDINEIKLDINKKSSKNFKKGLKKVGSKILTNLPNTIVITFSIASFVFFLGSLVLYTQGSYSGGKEALYWLISFIICLGIGWIFGDSDNKKTYFIYNFCRIGILVVGLIALMTFTIIEESKYENTSGEYVLSKIDKKNNYEIETLKKKGYYVGLGNKGYLNSETGDLYLIIVNPAENDKDLYYKLSYKKQELMEQSNTVSSFSYKKLTNTSLELPEGEYTFDMQVKFLQGVFKDDIIIKKEIPIISISDEEFQQFLE